MTRFLITFLISFILSSHLSSNLSFAQNTNDEQLKRQIDEVMKAREEMLKSLMDDSFSGEFEKRMEDIMKRFGGIGPGNSFDQSDSLAIGNYDWEETSTEKILKIKVTQSKDQPLDIKIENGMISIKGIAETLNGTIKSRINFQKSFSLPTDIDQSNPEFKNNEKIGELWITFKKMISKKSSKSKLFAPTPKAVEERIPVKPTDQDISI